jgi:hypothetical protein
MSQDELIKKWNSSNPHEKITLINDIIESGKNLSDKYKSLEFIDSNFEELPFGFKSWIIDFFHQED